jgi:dipeptidyl-peptidase 4
MSSTFRRSIALLAVVIATRIVLSAQTVAPPPAAQTALDWIARIFSGEFAVELAATPQWHGSRHEYLTGEPPTGVASEIVRREAGSDRREVLITRAQLTPPGAASPLDPEALDWSADASRVLIFTNSRRVWRTNSRGDYWLLDRKSNQLSFCPQNSRRRRCDRSPGRQRSLTSIAWRSGAGAAAARTHSI